LELNDNADAVAGQVQKVYGLKMQRGE